MTQKQRVLDLLLDGKPHVHMELYRLGCVAHSRVADLRRDGWRIACWVANDAGERVSVYQLIGRLEETTTAPEATGVVSSSGPDSASPTSSAPGPLQQLALDVPRGAYEVAA